MITVRRELALLAGDETRSTYEQHVVTITVNTSEYNTRQSCHILLALYTNVIFWFLLDDL